VIAFLSLYTIGLLLLMAYYFVPLIYLENSFKKIWRKSMILLFDNFGLTFFCGLTIFLFFILSSVLFILLPLVFGAFLVYLFQNGFQPIYDRYD